jgi:hypothetical protein
MSFPARKSPTPPKRARGSTDARACASARWPFSRSCSCWSRWRPESTPPPRERTLRSPMALRLALARRARQANALPPQSFVHHGRHARGHVPEVCDHDRAFAKGLSAAPGSSVRRTRSRPSVSLARKPRFRASAAVPRATRRASARMKRTPLATPPRRTGRRITSRPKNGARTSRPSHWGRRPAELERHLVNHVVQGRVDRRARSKKESRRASSSAAISSETS